jgi:hypothetical protein
MHFCGAAACQMSIYSLASDRLTAPDKIAIRLIGDRHFIRCSMLTMVDHEHLMPVPAWVS